MRRYVIQIGSQEHVIDVHEVTADTFEVTVAGQQVRVRLHDHDDLPGGVIAPHIEPIRTPAEPVRVQPAPAARPVTPVAAPPVAASPTPSPVAAPRTGNTAALMTAPMPGLILDVTVGAGQEVRRGEALLVLEAMKMKNALQATRDGRVAEIYVKAGQQVKYGDPLLRYAETTGEG